MRLIYEHILYKGNADTNSIIYIYYSIKIMLIPTPLYIYIYIYIYIRILDERFQLFTTMKIQVVVLWVVKPCSDVVRYRRFGGPC
jgi:hypothetical protein